MTNQEARQSNSAQGTPRERLLAAAAQVVADRGYDAATIKAIARAAGVTPGLVHYYFASKDELLVEMLREESARYAAAMQRVATQVPPERLAAVALGEPKERVARQPEWYRLRYALFALALHNDAIAPGVRDLLASGREGIAAMVPRALGATADPPEALAAVLLACFDGLALQRLLDPEVDLEAAYGALTRMVQALGHPQS
jgi:AcrR family transcriptional regulator